MHREDGRYQSEPRRGCPASSSSPTSATKAFRARRPSRRSARRSASRGGQPSSSSSRIRPGPSTRGGPGNAEGGGLRRSGEGGHPRRSSDPAGGSRHPHLGRADAAASPESEGNTMADEYEAKAEELRVVL